MTFRLATSADVPALSAIEEEAFPGDRLTPRRFRHFIRSSNSELWVHEDENGKPIFNTQGKVMKGPNYFKPDLKKIIQGQK